jgi:hypothetical protein
VALSPQLILSPAAARTSLYNTDRSSRISDKLSKLPKLQLAKVERKLARNAFERHQTAPEATQTLHTHTIFIFHSTRCPPSRLPCFFFRKLLIRSGHALCVHTPRIKLSGALSDVPLIAKKKFTSLFRLTSSHMTVCLSKSIYFFSLALVSLLVVVSP